MELKDYIEDGARKAGSLTALGKFLDLDQRNLTSAKAHRRALPIDLCIKLADYIGADRIAVISANELATEKKEEKRAFWSMSKAPMRVAVTGAAGQIGYSLLFRIASGEMLGKDQPVILQLLDLPQAQKAVKGVMMELDDCAFPLLAGMVATDDPNVAFKDADVCLLVGARPRTPAWSVPTC
jgi:hypothetical protein